MLITKDPVDMGFGLDLKIQGCAVLSTCVGNRPPSVCDRLRFLPALWRQMCVKKEFRSLEMAEWGTEPEGSVLGCLEVLWAVKVPCLEESFPENYQNHHYYILKWTFFQQCKGLKKTCPFCQLYVVTSTTSMESCWCQLLTEICKCSWISCAISRQYLRSTLHQVLWCIPFSCCCCLLKRL